MKNISDTLFIIPARGGSKGLPGKNTMKLDGKPLIFYSIDAARGVTNDENICVSTDDENIAKLVKEYGLNVSFIRPQALATDKADTWSVVHHALDFHTDLGEKYKRICLLQPTSPLRNSKHINECFQLWNEETEMIVSVRKSKKASVICNENENGFLTLTLNRAAKQRQDVLDYYEYNGAIYLLNAEIFKEKPVKDFTKIRKYVMSESDSVDVDDELDFKICEFLIGKKKSNSI